MNFSKRCPGFTFTRLHAYIVEENGAFTVRVRMHNHLKQEECVWGEEIAATFDIASVMIGNLASQFGISQRCIAIKISMDRFQDGTMH
jgi:hypothetical protein